MGRKNTLGKSAVYYSIALSFTALLCLLLLPKSKNRLRRTSAAETTMTCRVTLTRTMVLFYIGSNGDQSLTSPRGQP